MDAARVPRRYSRLPRRNSTSIDEDGNILGHGVKLGEFGKTDMQVAISNCNRREDASFSICMGKTGTSLPYQQTVPMDFARHHKNLFEESITLEGPTGETWTTVIREFYRAVRFGKGWRQFSVENRLQEGHQLLFTLVGKFRFRVQFFDQLGKRCTGYPPLPGAQPVAETQRQPDPQPGSQPAVDERQPSRRRGSEARTSVPAVPLMGTTPDSPISLNSDEDNVIPRQHGAEVPDPEASLPHQHMSEPEEDVFNAWNDSEDMETDDEGNLELDEGQHHIFRDSYVEEVRIHHPPATMQPLINVNPERTLLDTLNRGKQPILHSPDNRAHSPQIHDLNNSPSRGDEFPYQFYPEMRKKPVTVSKRPPPLASPVASYHEAGGSSGSSPAMRVLQQQGCTRFSQIVLQGERRDVSDQDRQVVVQAAKRFVSALENMKFLVVMRDEQVYRRFHLAIPGQILQATGTERASKVEVSLLDREQALYRAHWTRQNFCDTPLLDCDAWAKFAVDHALEEGDVCVFQLLQSKPAVSSPAVVFRVHIFRVAEITVRGAARLL